MRRWVCAALGAASVLAFAAPADAYVMIATVTGTVGTMSQSSGAAFAPFGTSLTGDQFTAVFAFDSNTPLSNDTATGIEAVGGICCLTPYPFSSALLTINGVTKDLARDPFSGVPFEADIKYDAAAGTVLFLGGRNDLVDSTLSIKMSGSNIPLSLDTPFSLTQDAGSLFRWQDFTLTNPSVPFGGTDQAKLIPTSLTVVRTVPEPATWAMMIGGFFGLGAALRWRRAMDPATA